MTRLQYLKNVTTLELDAGRDPAVEGKFDRAGIARHLGAAERRREIAFDDFRRETARGLFRLFHVLRKAQET